MSPYTIRRVGYSSNDAFVCFSFLEGEKRKKIKKMRVICAWNESEESLFNRFLSI